MTPPYSRYGAGTELIETMRVAFHRVCDVLQLDDDGDGPVAELVLMKIMEFAEAGEHDPEQLCREVLAELKRDHKMRQ